MAKKKAPEQPVLERVYTVPLRKEFMKASRWKRSKRAVSALRQFLQRHMKAEDVRLSLALNEKVWQHGIRNPPHHVKVTAKKNAEGVVTAALFGEQEKVPTKKEVKKATTQKAEVKEQPATETKEAKPVVAQ